MERFPEAAVLGCIESNNIEGRANVAGTGGKSEEG